MSRAQVGLNFGGPALSCSHSFLASFYYSFIVLVVEPNYIPNSEVCFSCAWTPFPNGGCGGDYPPTIVIRGVQGGWRQFLYPPHGEGFGGSTLEVKYWENFPCKIL